MKYREHLNFFFFQYLSNEDCHYDTSQINTENLSPPNVSPIHNAIHMSCESVKSHSTTQLNFTMNMSIDQSNNQHKEFLDHSLGNYSILLIYIH